MDCVPVISADTNLSLTETVIPSGASKLSWWLQGSSAGSLGMLQGLVKSEAITPTSYSKSWVVT